MRKKITKKQTKRKSIRKNSSKTPNSVGFCCDKKKSENFFCKYKKIVKSHFELIIFGGIVMAVIGFVLFNGFSSVSKMFNRGGVYLETSILSDLKNKITHWGEKIKELQGKIDDRKKCTEDEFWQEATTDVCNYWLYTQHNNHCRKFNVPTERIAIGTKICCEGNVYEKNKDKLVSCDGADVFFDPKKIYQASVVKEKGFCGLQVCQFYPKEGFHLKVDKNGNVLTDENGEVIIEKDCEESYTVSACSKQCGGGERVKTMMTKYCIEVEFTEPCNLQPCQIESIR